MNYLAHLYLSADKEEIMIGNFIADMITKQERSQLSYQIKQGIDLHYQIDTFTDAHSTVRHSRSFFFSEFRHYSRVIIDVLYDHFLAKNWNYYHRKPLADYVDEFYNYIDHHKHNLPYHVQKTVPVMIKYNWLYSYSSVDGIIKILREMSNRIDDGTRMDKCYAVFEENYQVLEKDFTTFFYDLQLNFSKDN